MRHLTLLAFASLGILTACGSNDVKETLGLTRAAPDEYRVVSRPPLSVPPQFNLRPPSGPGEHANPYATDKQAQSLILGTTPNTNTFALPSAADTASLPEQIKASGHSGAVTPEINLLKRAGAAEADPNVRLAIERDKAIAAPVVEDESWWQTLSILPGKPEPTVDAKQEAERIKQNQEEGKPVNEGDVPEVGGRDTGILGRILGY